LRRHSLLIIIFLRRFLLVVDFLTMGAEVTGGGLASVTGAEAA
jgi:hypothetical protein